MQGICPSFSITSFSFILYFLPARFQIVLKMVYNMTESICSSLEGEKFTSVDSLFFPCAMSRKENSDEFVKHLFEE